MKKRILIILTAACGVGAIAADASDPAPSVAVYDFTGDPAARSYGDKVTSLVTADLAVRTNLILLERAKLDKALSEHAFGISGMVSSDAAARIGQLTGAKVLVSGHVLMTGQNHLVIIANVIGTESGRLFAAKVEGGADNLLEVTSDLSSKIEQVVIGQATNFVLTGGESSAARLDRIAKAVTGTNRPAISVKMFWPRGETRYHDTAEWEFGIVLLKAGFAVVDGNSERKPDIEITGVVDQSDGPRRGPLFSYRTVIELKAQERQTGNILVIDRQESIATEVTSGGADRLAQIQAVDGLAERVLPILAK